MILWIDDSKVFVSRLIVFHSCLEEFARATFLTERLRHVLSYVILCHWSWIDGIDEIGTCILMVKVRQILIFFLTRDFLFWNVQRMYFELSIRREEHSDSVSVSTSKCSLQVPNSRMILF